MKRRLFTLVLLLALGAIVNIAVAWGSVLAERPLNLAALSSPEAIVWSEGEPAPADTVRNLAHVGLSLPPGDECNRFSWRVSRRRSGLRTELAAFERRDIERWECPNVVAGSRRGPFLALEVGAGWPARSARSLQWRDRPIDNSATPPPSTWHTRGAIIVARLGDSWLDCPRVLPCVPLWPGFAINTMFYAAVLWTMFAVPAALRRKRRVRRGLCSKCGYDLRGNASDACPECGAAVPLCLASAAGVRTSSPDARERTRSPQVFRRGDVREPAA